MKAIKLMERGKDGESFIFRTAAFMRANGDKIKCMDTENFIINQGRSHMKAIG